MGMVSAQSTLNTLETILSKLKDRGDLEEGSEGLKVLQLIQSPPVLENGAGAFAQGLTAYFSDEIIAVFSDMFGANNDLTKAINRYRELGAGSGEKPEPFSGYDIALAQERRGLEKYKKESPWKALGFEAGGALIPSLAFPGGQANMARVLATAAATGFASGVGSGKGDVKDRLARGAVGAVTSPVAAGALKGVGHLAGKGWQSLMTPGVAARGGAQATQMARDVILSDVGSLPEATKMVEAARLAGKPLALADVGTGSRGLVDAASLLSGPAKGRIRKFFVERDRGMIDRITSDLQRAFGKSARFFPEFRAMSKARSEKGGKIYDRAKTKIIPIDPSDTDDELTELFQRPVMSGAIETAYTIAGNLGVKLPRLRLDDFGRLVDKSGDPVTGVKTEFLHYVKMALDDKVFTTGLPSTGVGRTQQAGMKKVRWKLLDIIDSNNNTYKVARNYWAGETAALGAMKDGRTFLRADIDELADSILHMGRSEKEAFRIGAMQAMVDHIESSVDTANISRNILKKPRNRKLIRLTFDSGEKGTTAYNTFIGNLTTEMEMKMTSAQVLGGSPTTERHELVKSLREGAARYRPQPTGPFEMVLGLLRKNADDLADEQLAAAASRITDLMTTTDEKGMRKIMLELATPTGTRRVLATLKQVPPAIGGKLFGPFVTGAIVGGNQPKSWAPAVARTRAVRGLLD